MLVHSPTRSQLFGTAQRAVTMCLHDDLIPSHIRELRAAFDDATEEERFNVMCALVAATAKAYEPRPEAWQQRCAKWELRAA